MRKMLLSHHIISGVALIATALMGPTSSVQAQVIQASAGPAWADGVGSLFGATGVGTDVSVRVGYPIGPVVIMASGRRAQFPSETSTDLILQGATAGVETQVFPSWPVVPSVRFGMGLGSRRSDSDRTATALFIETGAAASVAITPRLRAHTEAGYVFGVEPLASDGYRAITIGLSYDLSND